MTAPVRLTTCRDKAFLLKRFLLNPYIKYEVFGAVRDGKILAYCACRDEVLQPLGTTVSRIVDLFGKEDCVPAVLGFMVARAEEKAHAYVDFSAFGSLYGPELASAGFSRLDEEEYALLPQVTAPIEPRPNMEFIGLHSAGKQPGIHSLTPGQVYFTRADSDRDRIARITQLQELQANYEAK